jgi:hypothetical protein
MLAIQELDFGPLWGCKVIHVPARQTAHGPREVQMFSRPQFLLPALSLVVGLFLDQSAGAVTCTLGFPAPVSLGAAPCLPSQLFENTWVIPASGPGVTGAEAMGPSGENIEPRRELPLTLTFEGATFTPGPTEGPTEEQENSQPSI